jgi:uncharacterized protein (DUF427 family)
MADPDSPRIEPCQKRVRGLFDGEVVVDTHQAKLVWEVSYYPAYYLPLADVTGGLLHANGRTREPDPVRGEAILYDLRHGGRVATDAAYNYPSCPELANDVRFAWSALDRWLEEDEEVIVHPRSPFTRVDVLPSSRHVQVVINGVTVAGSHRAMALFETGRPVRWYLPQTDIRMELLEPTTTRTGCPYKGWASYWNVNAGGERYNDLAWSYLRPLPESARIAEHICIWDHHVQTLVDGNAT